MLHLLNQGTMAAAFFQADTLLITTKSGTTVHELGAADLQSVSLTKLPVANRLTLLTKSGQDISINGLDRSTSHHLYTELSTRINTLLNDEAARKAVAAAPEIADRRKSITASLTSERYIRRSQAEAMTLATTDLHQQLDDRTREQLDPQSTDSLQWLEHATDADNLESVRSQLNQQFLQLTAPSVHEGHAQLRPHRRAGRKHRSGRGRHPSPCRRRHR